MGDVRVRSTVAGRGQFHHCLWTQAHTQNSNAHCFNQSGPRHPQPNR